MLRLFLFFLFFLLNVETGFTLSDFQEFMGDTHYIYHDSHKLLLVIKDKNCYYVNTSDFNPEALELFHRDATEAELLRILQSNETGQIHLSSIPAVNIQFQDVLTGFHCLRDGFMIFNVQGNVFVSARGEEVLNQLQSLQCAFEDGYCGWTQDKGDELDWTLHKGNTSLDGHTGPVFDHTSDNARGEYVFLNSSRGKNGDSAQLLSSFLAVASPVCLQFWYNMNGADVNTLAVKIRDSTQGEKVVWNITGGQGHNWLPANVTILPKGGTTQTQIVIGASRASAGNGDIALDDVRLTPGECVMSGSSSLVAHTVTAAKVPTVNDLSCDFEDGYCGWKQSVGDDLNWHLHKGRVPTNTGPGGDHTLGTEAGEYMLFNGSQGEVNATADMVSPYLPCSLPLCLRLWYAVSGNVSNRLEILLKDLAGYETVLQAVPRALGQNQGWQEVKVEISSRSVGGQQQIIIRANKGQSTDNDMAVDDVILSSGHCSP